MLAGAIDVSRTDAAGDTGAAIGTATVDVGLVLVEPFVVAARDRAAAVEAFSVSAVSVTVTALPERATGAAAATVDVGLVLVVGPVVARRLGA